MRVFITGGTGYIGSVVVEKLITAGHDVSALARSEESADRLSVAGVQPLRGDLGDRDAIAGAARSADAVIHTAADVTADTAALDRNLIEAVLEGLGSSGRAFLYTSGVWLLGNTGTEPATESSVLRPVEIVAWRAVNEQIVLGARGVRGIVIRPAMVYGRDGGFAGGFQRKAAADGLVQYPGSGENRWGFVHVDDLADLYLLALSAPGGSVYLAAAGPSVKLREVAEAAAASGGGRAESLPMEEARRQMGGLADALALDQVVSAEKAMRELGWKPSRPGVLEELRSDR